ncbi:hypothetical protein JW777_00765 [bacterium]|nr:hypothetical protein [bacterium]
MARTAEEWRDIIDDASDRGDVAKLNGIASRLERFEKMIEGLQDKGYNLGGGVDELLKQIPRYQMNLFEKEGIREPANAA